MRAMEEVNGHSDPFFGVVCVGSVERFAAQDPDAIADCKRFATTGEGPGVEH